MVFVQYIICIVFGMFYPLNGNVDVVSSTYNAMEYVNYIILYIYRL